MPRKGDVKGDGGRQGPGSKANVHSRLRKLGLLDGRKSKQLTFEIFFPRPPYRGAQYRAARGKDGLYNFVGLVLGHGGATIQRIQKASGAKIEVRDSAGNLNGAHPSSHGDPSLHAWVAAPSRQRLDRAVALLLEVLQPANGRLRDVPVEPGGSAVLDAAPAWGEAAAAEPAASSGAPRASGAPGGGPNAWASNRLQLKAAPPDSRQMSPVSSLTRSRGAAAVAESNTSSDAEEEPQHEQGRAAGAPPLTPAKAVPPPPPPPPRSLAGVTHPATPTGATAAPPQRQPATPAAAQVSAAGAAAASPRLLPPAPQPQEMATVWAKGLHHSDSLETPCTPCTPCGPAERSTAASLTPAASGASSGWSLWSDHSGAARAPSFYEQLQAAASDGFPGSSAAAAAGGSMQLPGLAQAQASAAYAPAQPAQPVGPPFPGLGAHGAALGYAPHAPLHAPSRSADVEREMQQLLAAVASMATLDG